MHPKLLFIADDVASCEVVDETLTRRGFEVTIATSGALEQNEFDVVLSDLRMPGMSGLELCRRLHGRWPQLPVVLVTAFGSIETAVTAIRAGAYDFITKPFKSRSSCSRWNERSNGTA